MAYAQLLRASIHPDKSRYIYIEELVQNLPSGLTNEVSLGYLDSKAYLTVPGVYQCQGFRQLLDAFVNVIEICVDTYFRSPDEQPRISSDTIKRYYPLWREPAIHKVGLLLQAEPGIWFSFSEGDNWTCQIAREIRRFRNVKTIEQYLEKRKIQRNMPGSMPVQPTTIAFQNTVPPMELGDLQLHPDIRSRCWDLYSAEKYDEAILNATKALEVAVRTKAKLPHDRLGADLMSKAFNPNEPILQYSTVKAEQEGMMSLLRGIIQVFKNPQSHRFVGVQSKSECLGVLLMCSNLLYVVDNAEYVGTV
jgi:uncharacterized protein (TIGR02391 family)